MSLAENPITFVMAMNSNFSKQAKIPAGPIYVTKLDSTFILATELPNIRLYDWSTLDWKEDTALLDKWTKEIKTRDAKDKERSTGRKGTEKEEGRGAGSKAGGKTLAHHRPQQISAVPAKEFRPLNLNDLKKQLEDEAAEDGLHPAQESAPLPEPNPIKASSSRFIPPKAAKATPSKPESKSKSKSKTTLKRTRAESLNAEDDQTPRKKRAAAREPATKAGESSDSELTKGEESDETRTVSKADREYTSSSCGSTVGALDDKTLTPIDYNFMIQLAVKERCELITRLTTPSLLITTSCSTVYLCPIIPFSVFPWTVD